MPLRQSTLSFRRVAATSSVPASASELPQVSGSAPARAPLAPLSPNVKKRRTPSPATSSRKRRISASAAEDEENDDDDEEDEEDGD